MGGCINDEAQVRFQEGGEIRGMTKPSTKGKSPARRIAKKFPAGGAVASRFVREPPPPQNSRFFNTTGLCRPEHHYMLPPADRLAERLKDPRVKKVVQTILVGGTDPTMAEGDDFLLSLDLGLVSLERGTPPDRQPPLSRGDSPGPDPGHAVCDPRGRVPPAMDGAVPGKRHDGAFCPAGGRTRTAGWIWPPCCASSNGSGVGIRMSGSAPASIPKPFPICCARVSPRTFFTLNIVCRLLDPC